MSKECLIDAYFRNLNDLMNRNLEIERCFDDMMEDMKAQLHNMLKERRSGQGNNLFYTSCFIGDYEYELCIDHDEEENLISKDVVKELNLRTERLYQPYYIVVENHRVKVTRYARVPVSIGSYKAVVSCDVVPLSDVYLIFGRSWLSLHNVRHNASRTRYSFSFGGKKHVLESLPPMKQCDYQIGDSKAMEIDRGAIPDVNLVEAENIEPELKNGESGGVVELENEMECDVVTQTEDIALVVEKIEADGTVGPTSPTTCSSSISSSLQVREDHPLEERTGPSDIPNPTNILPMDVLVPIDIDGKPKHTFIDPFVVYCTVILASNPYDYVAAPEKIICIEHSRHSYALVSLVRYSSSARGSSSLKPYLRLVFDPGISLVFVAGSSCCVLVAAFYDILLIRGRILSNREGMM